jgi:hypothetical protein
MTIAAVDPNDHLEPWTNGALSSAATIQKRSLGQEGLEVSVIGPGCMGMTSGDSPAGDGQKMINLIRTAPWERHQVLRHR